jgi:hypothetical protein
MITEVHNFIRRKVETISQTMARATALFHKLRLTSTEGEWPEKRDSMREHLETNSPNN